MKELRLFLLLVGLPAILLMAAGARLVFVGWQIDTSEREMHHEDWWPHPPPPPKQPPIRGLFSPDSAMNGPRDATIFGCLLGLTLLSLVSGSWLLVRAARQARREAFLQTDFVSNISHEFKTPLTTICLCAELAQDDGLDPARRKKALTAILNESERLKRLVLNALDFSRLEKKRYRLRLNAVDVAALARETCEAFSSRLGGDRVRAPEGSCTATGDADAVRQILANLLDNAAKYAPGGEIEVKAGITGDRAFVSVADRGPGLSPEELRHVFDRFWRGDNSITRETGGSGLGLAIARGLARGMGGDLTAANREDGGSVFTLEMKT